MSLAIRQKIKGLLATKVTGLPYLCFTAKEAGSTVGMSVTGTPTQGQAFQYSTDCKNWDTFTPGSTTITLTNVGNKVWFKGNNSTISESSSIYYKFVMTGKIAASGNIQSLLDETCRSLSIPNCCYINMFRNCSSLTSAPTLPATTLGECCYESMFKGCTSLTTAPALPATTLAEYCYYQMFYNCTSLTTAPALPATTLADMCYNFMFYGCTSLTTVPALPAIIFASGCYCSMFCGCSSLQLYSSSGEGHTNLWRIPTSGSADGDTRQLQTFYGTIGDYGGYFVDFSITNNFYTQNPPV